MNGNPKRPRQMGKVLCLLLAAALTISYAAQINNSAYGDPPANDSANDSANDNISKSAYLNGSAIAENGTASNPVEVSIGDLIHYSISTVNEVDTVVVPVKYDVLFVLDWSGSMNTSMNTGGDYAWAYQRSITLDMCDFIISNCPGSRVAVMAMNAVLNCYYRQEYTNIQFQTDFLEAAAYAGQRPGIDAALMVSHAYIQDDNGSFLDAAIDKMAGVPGASYGGPSTGGAVSVDPRTGSDLDERLPVIIHISDFQMTEEAGGMNASGARYWSEVMKGCADRLESLLPTGRLQTVRLDHSFNAAFSLSLYDGLMEDYLSPAGRADWGFTKVAYNTPYDEALASVKEDFAAITTVEALQGTIINDPVPAGLAVDVASISHGGVYDPASHTITWDLTDEEAGEVTVGFDAIVSELTEVYVNSASAVFVDGSAGASNATYHQPLVAPDPLDPPAPPTTPATGDNSLPAVAALGAALLAGLAMLVLSSKRRG